jgi:Leucine-rich repeat (LRR) protein
VLGLDKAYNWRANVQTIRDVALDRMSISSLGEKDTIRNCIPGAMVLYLDKNLLYCWDQYFDIIRQLGYLRSFILTGNKFRRIDRDYFKDKDINQMIHQHLAELVLIDMALDWEQIDILSPVLCYIEQLHLVRNNCSTILTKYKLPQEQFKLLKFINLEANGIKSWDEVSDFRNLPNLKRLTLNKNPIKKIYYKPGWQDLLMLSMEDCEIDNWQSFD